MNLFVCGELCARLAAAGGRGQLEGQVSGPVDSLHVVVGAAEGAGGLGRVGGARGLRQSYGVIVACRPANGVRTNALVNSGHLGDDGGRRSDLLSRRNAARRRRGGVGSGEGLAHRDSDGGRRRAGGWLGPDRGGVGAVVAGDGELGRLRVDHVDVGAVDGVAAIREGTGC